jgi:hypothetical protein
MATPVWDPRRGVYVLQGVDRSGQKAGENPSGNEYYDPNTGTVSYLNANNEQKQPSAQSYWSSVFAPVKGEAPGSTDLGQKNVGGQNVDLLQTPQGTYYYQSGGKNYALSTQQQQDLQLPQVAGYDQAGNAYYSPYDAKTMGPNAPTAEANALQQIKKNDPNTYNAIQNLSGYYKGQQNVLNGQLDPTSTTELQQAARAAQVARGNPYGTAQASQEAMTTGQYGQQLRSATAQNMQGYLNSGTTPQAMGSRELGDIINQSQAANVGTPFQSTYSPQNTYTYLNPSAGQQFAQGADNWYNGMNQQYGMGGQGGLSPGMSAGAGALSGAASGAAAGTAIYPGIGTIIGGIGGAVIGGAGGYMSGRR